MADWGRNDMTALREIAEDYLRMRRALGYKLKISGWHLERFVSYLEQTEATTVTIENAVAWATSAGTDRSYWATRLSIVRQFARHLQTLDPACEVPPAQLLPYRAPRAIPYLYEPEEITALMRAAGAHRTGAIGGQLPDADRPAGGQRPAPRRSHPSRPRRR
jgi:hypothetical protein